MTVKRICVWVTAAVVACAAALVVARAIIAHAHTPISSPSQVPPRPTPRPAPRDTYAETESQAWGLARGYFGPGGQWAVDQVTSLVEVQTTYGKAMHLLMPQDRVQGPAASSTAWVFEATGRFQSVGVGVVGSPPVYDAAWALVQEGTPGVSAAPSKAPINLDALGSVEHMGLSDLTPN